MKKVFILHHVHFISNLQEDVKLIGVYRSEEAARAAIERLNAQPGFSEHRRIFGSFPSSDVSGFYINEYELDKDHWTEGFLTE